MSPIELFWTAKNADLGDEGTPYLKMLTQMMMTMQLGVGAWLDPRALGDTGGSIFHPVRREITQEYAPGNLLA